MDFSRLHALGWKPFFWQHLDQEHREDRIPARVIARHQGIYRIATPDGERLARLSGRALHTAPSPGDLPVVGDWVTVSLPSPAGEAVIQSVLPRLTSVSRKAAGNVTEAQTLVANVDTLFLVSALNREFEPRRIERYLIIARESGAAPVMVLNKADLCPDAPQALAQVRLIAPRVPIYTTTAASGEGIEDLRRYLTAGTTGALLGSSGVGKSTLINALLGRERQATTGIREDDRGRHTTTHSDLIHLPGGGMLIDTPGLREIQLWESASGFEGTFEDIVA